MFQVAYPDDTLAADPASPVDIPEVARPALAGVLACLGPYVHNSRLHLDPSGRMSQDQADPVGLK